MLSGVLLFKVPYDYWVHQSTIWVGACGDTQCVSTLSSQYPNGCRGSGKTHFSRVGGPCSEDSDFGWPLFPRLPGPITLATMTSNCGWEKTSKTIPWSDSRLLLLLEVALVTFLPRCPLLVPSGGKESTRGNFIAFSNTNVH
jgi:hypothetical protein